jgi:hypothetical protein
MAWALYTALTARNRAIEAGVAFFALFWASVVLSYALSGKAPLSWAVPPGMEQWVHPAVLLGACAIHMAGTALNRPAPLPAILRAFGMLAMAGVFGHLSWQGLGLSAGPTYAAIMASCILGASNAAKDAHFARSEVRRAA